MSLFKIEPLDCGYKGVLPLFTSYTQCIRVAGVGELLSDPKKMPEYAFNIPAQECKAGKFMVDIEGQICHDCYALPEFNEDGSVNLHSSKGGRYRFNPVQLAMYRRFNFAVFNPNFVRVMTYLITKKIKRKFRWFDSGDIQSEKMLDDICKICRNTPHILHWLPTKEWKICKRYIEAGNKIPANLDLRLSALSINGRPPTKRAKRLGLNTSTVMTAVVWDKFIATKSKGLKCPSSTQDNECKDCEACWRHEVINVGYKWH
jgi:hypothetical protein